MKLRDRLAIGLTISLASVLTVNATESAPKSADPHHHRYGHHKVLAEKSEGLCRPHLMAAPDHPAANFQIDLVERA